MPDKVFQLNRHIRTVVVAREHIEIGDVAMFPRGAINYPGLFASACVLFDSIVVLKPLDIEATHWQPPDDVWTYKPVPNPNADAFWDKSAELVEIGVLKCFPANVSPHEIVRRNSPPDDEMRDDFVDITFCISDAWVSSWHSLGFQRYFNHLETLKTPLILSLAEMNEPQIEPRLKTNEMSDLTTLNSLAAQIVAECIPELGIGTQTSDQFAQMLVAIRKATGEERVHFKSFVGSIANTLAGLSTPEEKVCQIEHLIRDSADIYHSYRSKMMEVSRRLKLPLRFISIIKSLVTLDFLSAAQDISGVSEREGMQSLQEKRALGFLRHVDEVKDFWIT